MILHFFLPFLGLFFGEAKRLHPKPKMIVILDHRLKLIKADSVIFVIVILPKLSTSNFRAVIFFDNIQRFQVTKNSSKELAKTVFGHFLTIGIDLKDELSGLCVILMQGGSCTDELVEIN